MFGKFICKSSVVYLKESISAKTLCKGKRQLLERTLVWIQILSN